uniref:Uncharacterized protein n=1 Tax=Schistosoma haematobium TaxID=6185 RepID=A0A094ZSC9_SCHHA
MMAVSIDDSENNFTEKNRTTNIKKITSIAKSWGINGKMTIRKLRSTILLCFLITNLLGVPTARKMFSVPKFISYLSSKSDDSELNLRKQLLLWLVNLPSQNLVDHLASQYGLHDQNWNISTENKKHQKPKWAERKFRLNI